MIESAERRLGGRRRRVVFGVRIRCSCLSYGGRNDYERELGCGDKGDEIHGLWVIKSLWPLPVAAAG